MGALFARAHGDDTGYRHHRDRYRAMARTLGFEGHIAWAEAMRCGAVVSSYVSIRAQGQPLPGQRRQAQARADSEFRPGLCL